VREAGNAQSQRRASGAVQRFSNKKTSNLLWGNPCGLRLRASLRVSLRMRMFPDTPGILGIAVKQ